MMGGGASVATAGGLHQEPAATPISLQDQEWKRNNDCPNPTALSASNTPLTSGAVSKPVPQVAAAMLQSALKTIIVPWESAADDVVYVGFSDGSNETVVQTGEIARDISDRAVSPHPAPPLRKGFGFSRQMFSRAEWETLNNLCMREGISQVDLNRVFNRFLTDEAALVRKMRVNAMDISKRFDRSPRVVRDTAAVFFPGVLLRRTAGLAEPHSKEEVSFARFVVTAFAFCAQPPEDLVFDLMSLLRNNTSIETSAQLSAHSLRELVRVLSSDFPNNVVKDIVCNRCACVESNSDVDIMHAMRLSQKYPLMFFQLVLFQKLVQRLIFGDKFWARRGGPEKSRFATQFAKYIQGNEGNIDLAEKQHGSGRGSWLDLREATRVTARSIVNDYWACRGSVSELFPYSASNSNQNVDTLNTELVILLKNTMGPRAARELLDCAELTLNTLASEPRDVSSSPPLPESREEGEDPPDIVRRDDEVALRFRDEASGADFVYLPASGERGWVRRITQGGRLLVEKYEFK